MDNHSKTFARSEIVKFTSRFVEDDFTPCLPINPSYPQFQVRNPSGDLVHSGVGTAADSGSYYFEWQIPENAELSNDTTSWRVEWTMVTADNRQLVSRENFLVVCPSVETPEDHSIITVVMDSKPFRLYNYFEMEPVEVTLDVYNALNTMTPIKSYTMGDMSRSDVDGHIAYFLDIPEGVPQGDYLVIWTYRYFEASDENREFKSVRSVRPTVLRMVDQLRVFIDRFNKRQSAPNAFSDSDLIEFLEKGLQLVNGWYPMSNPAVTWDSLHTTGFEVFVLVGAAVWGLESQFLLENDLSFDFQGLTTSLSYDRKSGLSETLGRMNEWLNTNLTKAKVAQARSAANNSIGSVAVRPYTLRNYARQIVVPFSGATKGGLYNLTDLLVLLGL